MGFKPKEEIDAARDIVTNAVERSSDIVENAGHIIKGDIAGGTGDIVHNSLDIATYAVERPKEGFTGPPEAEEQSDGSRGVQLVEPVSRFQVLLRPAFDDSRRLLH